jgi:endothelial-specific receptor tyrosine kinase
MLRSATTLVILLLVTTLTSAQFFGGVQSQHKGCFKDDPSKRDLPHKIYAQDAQGSVAHCIEECAKAYFLFAGLQNGNECFCGSKYGYYGPSLCKSRCTQNSDEVCGGSLSNSVYFTGVKVPGPPTSLKLEKATETSLLIKWSSPEEGPKDFITDYHIQVYVNFSYDPSHNSRTFSPKHIQLSNTSTMTTILGLHPGSLYNVTVAAASKDGIGKSKEDLYWTEIGRPDVPQAPMLIQHDHHDEDFHGEIHVQLQPMKRNRNGPISKYRVLVIDETNPAPFSPENTFGYHTAQARGLNYWIAAEVDKDFFAREDHVEFVVGDNRTYGRYLNYGPLPSGRDFHVTFGVVSQSGHGNRVTKVSYAKVSHDQHAMENIVVFKFHGHDHDDHDDHDDDHGSRKKGLTLRDNHDHHDDKAGGHGDNLAIGLSVAIAIFGVILAMVVIFYAYLRWTTYKGARSRGSRGDVQELTTHISSIETQNYAVYDNDSVDARSHVGPQMEVLRTKVWNIPRNFLDLTHEVIGRGRFGSLVKGTVNKNSLREAVNIQVVPGKILEEDEMRTMMKDLEMVVRYENHPNLVQLVGLCEDKDTIFVVLEQAWPSLKQALLDSRALVHNPVYAETNRRFSNLREDVVLNVMLGISRGMDHLSKMGILHRKLCSRNIFLANDQPKIGAVGITSFAKPGQEVDLSRWTAQEAFKSNNYISKCDVWSLGIVLWECSTLGATPYPDVKSKDLPSRVMRGLRLCQTPYLSDELYQLMLQCWQIDLDERPTFEEIADYLSEMAQCGQVPLNYGIYQGFAYEPYSMDLELEKQQ